MHWSRWILPLVGISTDVRKLASFDIPTRDNVHRYQYNTLYYKKPFILRYVRNALRFYDVMKQYLRFCDASLKKYLSRKFALDMESYNIKKRHSILIRL